MNLFLNKWQDIPFINLKNANKMRLSVLLYMITFVCASASVSYSQETKITMNLPNTTVRKALENIKQQTNFSFWYRNEDIDLDKTIAVVANRQDVRLVLDQVLVSQNLSYTIDDKHIIIYKKAEPNTSSAQQQGKHITGIVMDTEGEAVIGVNVIEKGVVSNGTITDINGNFSLNVSPGATLVISYVGYSTQEVAVGNRNNMNIVLEESTLGLDEVVVIGYGTVRRADLTGSVASVTGAQLKDIPVTSASQAIVGRMPGVQVTKTDGSPDADIKIRVRGGGSITQDNSPLFIVDGFPVDDINNIAPSDIASIDILKDASSTAIYGARGANGVIIITTKSGIEGNSKVSYNMYFGVKNITKKLDVLNPYEYVFLQYELQDASTNLNKYFGDFQDFDLYKPEFDVKKSIKRFGKLDNFYYLYS
jgi:TonB-dependent SusC/RagA subfamily outer membrane receptor